MYGAPSPGTIRSLAAAATGEAVEVKRILFGALRDLCNELGVREGDVVRCKATSPSHLLLETPAGRTVALETDWARFIQIGPPARLGHHAAEPTTAEAPRRP